HRGQDHVGWPAVTRESRARVQGEIAAARATGVPLATVRVKAISCARTSLTAWAGNHGCGVYQYQASS
ncbi:MAG TPA: hypothetical protein VGX03_09065, partial [Candidatus Binatia bacterium]|nr:hypothetical protein [Candidatus Binatia bacterium]